MSAPPPPVPVPPRLVFFLLLAGVALGGIGLTARFELHHRAAEIDRHFDTASVQARAFEDHLTQSLTTLTLTLVDAAESVADEESEAQWSKDLGAALRVAPFLRSVALLDVSSSVVAGTNPDNLGRHVAIDAFLPRGRDSAHRLRLGTPWTGRDFHDGRPATSGDANAPGFLPVSMDLALKDGRRVALLAAVNADFFINHYTLDFDPERTTVDVLRYDGLPLMSTARTGLPAQPRSVDLTMARRAQHGPGRLEQQLADGTALLSAYRASPAYPFAIAVHVDKALALKNWSEEATQAFAVVLAVLLAAAALATRTYFRLERSTRLRVAAVTSLNASEARYRDTFEHAVVGFAHAAPDGRLLHCNPFLCDMLGYSNEELKGRAIAEITHPDDQAQSRSQRERLEAGEFPSFQFEKRYLRKSGEPVWVRLNVCAVRDAAGAVEYTVSVIENIHLRKLRQLATQALDTELTGDAFLRHITQTLTELLELEFAFVCEPHADSPRRFEMRALCVDGRIVENFSYDLAGTPCELVTDNKLRVYADGVQRHFPDDALAASMGIESYAAVALGKGRAPGVPPSILGVMSRRPLRNLEAVQTLLPWIALLVSDDLARKREAQKFRDLVDGSPTAVFLIDAQFTICMSSRAGEQMFGWEPQGLVGQALGVLFPQDYQAAYAAQFRRYVEPESGATESTGADEIWGLRRNGSFFPTQIQLRTLPTAEGRMTVAYVQDITERKQAQAALLLHNEELEDAVATRTTELLRARDEALQASRAKSAFLATMSHEIRTPMNGVVGMIDVLEQTRLEDEQVEIVQTVRQSAHALLAIVDDVLDFSKIEAGHLQVDREPVDVVGVVEAVCDTLAPLASGKGTELMLFTDPAIPRPVVGDAMRLRQVLLNLAGNAIKFSSVEGGGGRVSVRATTLASEVQPLLEFSVTDNGIGMDEQVQARLFTPFSQADSGTTRRFGGTGLGLSISQRLVDLMGGEISVRSEPGQGSTFSVRVPLVALSGDTEFEADAIDLAGLRCVVLGGALSPADDLADYLQHSGATPRRAADAASARQWLTHCAPGAWTCVIADADETAQATLAELRALGAARADLALTFVVMERGQRRASRMTAPDVVALGREVLHRRTFLNAVALAAGRETAAAQGDASRGAVALVAPLSAQEASAERRLILVAEDNEINQKVVLRQLALLGYTARVAVNGREALALWQHGDFALLLTDLHMPQLDGYALALAIRGAEAGRRRTPIVALTANALKGEAKRCLDLGMDDYMTKPVQLAELRAMLAKWLPATAPRRADAPPAPASRPAALAAVLDVRVLEALIGDDPEVIDEFLQDFRASANTAARKMRAACLARQAQVVESLAHQLKSSARSVGALGLGELCARLEAAGQAGEHETLTALWPKFETELAAVDEFLVASQV